MYPLRLRDRLPIIHVTLRPADAKAPVNLQLLFDQCHEPGRYHLLNCRLKLDPPLPPEEESWINQILKVHQLR